MKKLIQLFIFIGFATFLLTSCSPPVVEQDCWMVGYFVGFTVQINNLPNLSDNLLYGKVRIDSVDRDGNAIYSDILLSQLRRVPTVDGYRQEDLEEGSIRFVVISRNHPGDKTQEEKDAIKAGVTYLGLRITYDGKTYGRDQLVRYENGEMNPMNAVYNKNIPNWVEYPLGGCGISYYCDFLSEGTYVMDGLPDSD
ncbi:MAG: hypothetical protein B0D92_05740 [Spirochaeta sp. LUC14_002_19_P3]|nr:MAG: hypothetical protein B0D92_05740 [Spirochaeta sp. LUC14_002_19_P3]